MVPQRKPTPSAAMKLRKAQKCYLEISRQKAHATVSFLGWGKCQGFLLRVYDNTSPY